MQRTTRIWLGLGTAVMVGGTTVDRTALAGSFVMPPAGPPADAHAGWRAVAPERLFTAQAEGGEGGPGEGGGQVLGTITEFRLSTTAAAAFDYDATAEVAAYARLVCEAYGAAHEAAAALRDAIGALDAEPSAERLEDARRAWLAARGKYMLTEAFQFYAGPVDAPEGPLPRLNGWPVDPALIRRVIDDPTAALDFRSLARMNQAADGGAITTGLHVMEFLLWGEEGSLAHAELADGAGERRRAYLASLAQLLVNDLNLLVAAWAPDRNNYRAAVEAMDQRNAIGRAFNGMTVLVGYEIPLRRIGAGLFPSNESFQPSPFSGTSDSDNRLALDGARDVYYGSGFDVLLGRVDADLAARVDAAFARAETALEALDTPYNRFLAPPAGSPERAAGEEAVRALTDLGRDLRSAGNRLGVLVVVPGL